MNTKIHLLVIHVIKQYFNSDNFDKVGAHSSYSMRFNWDSVLINIHYWYKFLLSLDRAIGLEDYGLRVF